MRSISRRDHGAARAIARLIERDPSRTVVVIFGESHLATNHLPRRVRALLAAKSLALRELLILQNVDSIYWKTQEQSVEHVQAVCLKERQYCVFNATPIEKYESFRQYLQGCLEEDASGDWSRFAQTILETLLEFLNVRKSEAVIDYLPVAGQELPLAAAAEAFARFIHQTCRGEVQKRMRRSEDDQFFVNVIENALGYFCSKLLDSSRDGIQSLAERVLSRIGDDELSRAITLLIDPAKRPGTRHITALRNAVESSVGRQKIWEMVAQLLGYALGRRIYQAYLESRISRREIQTLLYDPLNTPQRPLQCYIELSQRVA
jgi:hypothetical protein